MASATIADHGFPPGTSVDAYPAQNQVAGQRPAGTATATATVAANGALTFNGLAEKISYVAWAQGRGVRFAADVDGLEGPPSGFAARVVALERFVSTKDDTAVFNVKTPIGIFLGAKGDNSTDDYDAIMRTIAAAESYVSGASWERSAVVKVPMGSYKTRATIKVRVPNIVVLGDGSGNPKGSADPSSSPVYGGSVIRPTAAFTDPWVLDFARAENDYALAGNRVIGLSVDGYATGTTYDGNGYLTGGTAIGGIRFRVFSGGMYDVTVTRLNGDAFYHEAIDHVTTWPKGAWDCRFDSIRADTVGGNGFHASPGASDSMVVSSIFEYTNGHGIYLEGPGYQLIGNDTYNCLGNGVNALTRAQIIIGNRHIDCNGGLYLWGGLADGGATIVSGNQYRSCSYSGDGVWDGINIAPTGTVRGINIGPNSFSTLQRNGPANRMRYCVNVANANAVETSVAEQTYDFLSPATSCFATGPLNDAGTNSVISGSNVSVPTVASSATVTLPGHPAVKISGTATITSITASYAGRVVRVIFTGTASATGLTDGSNLKLAGNLVYTPDDTVTLVCDGTNWFEMCRSVN